MNQRDPKDLREHKRNYPLLNVVPDKKFAYMDGKWMISMQGVRLLAFLHKRPDMLDFAIKAEEVARRESAANI